MGRRGTERPVRKSISKKLRKGDDKIKVNCVSPGVVRTRFRDYLTREHVKNNIETVFPCTVKNDAADAICKLIKNDFITGENLVIDGGMTMRIV